MQSSSTAPAVPEGKAPKSLNACSACQVTRLKCLVEAGQVSCQRCLAKGAPCVFVPKSVKDASADANKMHTRCPLSAETAAQCMAAMFAAQRYKTALVPPQSYASAILASGLAFKQTADAKRTSWLVVGVTSEVHPRDGSLSLASQVHLESAFLPVLEHICVPVPDDEDDGLALSLAEAREDVFFAAEAAASAASSIAASRAQQPTWASSDGATVVDRQALQVLTDAIVSVGAALLGRKEAALGFYDVAQVGFRSVNMLQPSGPLVSALMLLAFLSLGIKRDSGQYQLLMGMAASMAKHAPGVFPPTRYATVLFSDCLTLPSPLTPAPSNDFEAFCEASALVNAVVFKGLNITAAAVDEIGDRTVKLGRKLGFHPFASQFMRRLLKHVIPARRWKPSAAASSPLAPSSSSTASSVPSGSLSSGPASRDSSAPASRTNSSSSLTVALSSADYMNGALVKADAPVIVTTEDLHDVLQLMNAPLADAQLNFLVANVVAIFPAAIHGPLKPSCLGQGTSDPDDLCDCALGKRSGHPYFSALVPASRKLLKIFTRGQETAIATTSSSSSSSAQQQPPQINSIMNWPMLIADGIAERKPSPFFDSASPSMRLQAAAASYMAGSETIFSAGIGAAICTLRRLEAEHNSRRGSQSGSSASAAAAPGDGDDMQAVTRGLQVMTMCAPVELASASVQMPQSLHAPIFSRATVTGSSAVAASTGTSTSTSGSSPDFSEPETSASPALPHGPGTDQGWNGDNGDVPFGLKRPRYADSTAADMAPGQLFAHSGSSLPQSFSPSLGPLPIIAPMAAFAPPFGGVALPLAGTHHPSHLAPQSNTLSPAHPMFRPRTSSNSSFGL